MRYTALAIAVAAATICPTTTHAYLGGFEEQDGYIYGTPNNFTLGGNDVTRYNAGQFGTNNGGPGGPAVSITPDTGLWQAIAGGRLLNQANDYYVIRHSAPGGHSSPNVLGMTTGNSGFVGIDSLYHYSFDSRDFDGAAPASLTGDTVDVEFLWCPQNVVTSTLTSPGATIQFIDSAGATWFELGVFGVSENVSYRIGGGAGTWTATGFNASAAFSDFDQVFLTFDLAADTVSFSFFETAATTLHNVLSNAPLGGDMDYLDTMGLFMQAENTKNFMDDFDFIVNKIPEPATGLMALAAAVE